MMLAERPAARRVLVAVAVIAIGIAFALAYGDVYAAKNQETYLLDGLVRAFPDLYRNDWFVTQNHHYHVAFAYLTAPLFALDPDGAIAFGVGQVAVMTATFAAIYGLVAAVTARRQWLVFLGVIGLLALGGNRAIGGTYLYAGYFQPSSLATLGWLLAMNAWLRDRQLAAGIALAVGGAFHLNYALLGIGAFGACELALRGFGARRLLALLGPSLVVLVAFLPALLVSSRTSDGALALDVLVRFEFPGHFKPARLRLDMCSLVGWQLIAIALRPIDRTSRAARLAWFAMVTSSLVIVAVVLVHLGPLLTLTRLFAWRIAPFGMLAAQILLFVETRAIARGERERPSGWQLVGLVAAATLIVYNAFTRRREVYPEVIACVMIACAIAIAARRAWLASATCAALCAFALWSARARLRSPVMFDSFEAEVTKWARTQSPRDAVFLTPPYLGEFRLRARRAVVVDDKSPPMYLDELVAWYRRLCASVGARTLASPGEGWDRWDALSADHLTAIAAEFHADYVVIEKQRSSARLAAPIAYEDSANVVYAIDHARPRAPL